MSTEHNKAIVRRFNDEFITGGRSASADELLAADFVDHTAMPGMPPGPPGVKQFFAFLKGAFPDLRAVIYDQVAEGDKVVTRKAFLATHQGDFMGIPPSGKAVTISVIDVIRLANGQMVEHWAVVDQLGLMQQLGAIPAPA